MSELRCETFEEEEQEEQEIAILDDASAEMLMSRIADAEKEYERMQSWYKSQLEKIKEKRDATVAWAEGCLRGYFDMVPTHDTKTTRSYQLPGGKLVMKQPLPTFDVQDTRVIPWLRQNHLAMFIRTKEEVNWAELKKMLKVSGDGMVTEDGEIVPGITVIAKEPEFHAIPNK